MALDIKQTGVIQGLPLQFSGNNLAKSIRFGTPKDAQFLRLAVDLTRKKGKTKAVKQQNGATITRWSLPLMLTCLRPRHRLHLGCEERVDPAPVMPSRTTTPRPSPVCSP
ncbi:hypothetical protein MJ588_02940 [Klebsiella pneumoniae]|nr:hypothetical protein MJ588_02940 [Klebsiella pneumoniae]